MSLSLFDAALQRHLVNKECPNKTIYLKNSNLQPSIFRGLIKDLVSQKKKVLVLIGQDQETEKYSKWLAMDKLSSFCYSHSNRTSLEEAVYQTVENLKSYKLSDSFSLFETAKWKYTESYKKTTSCYQNLNQEFLGERKLFHLASANNQQSEHHGLSTIGFIPNINLTKSDWLINKGRIKELAELHQIYFRALSKLDKLALKYADESNTENGVIILENLIDSAQKTQLKGRTLELEIKSFWNTQLSERTSELRLILQDQLASCHVKSILAKNKNFITAANSTFFKKQNTRNVAKEKYLEFLSIFTKKHEDVFGELDPAILRDSPELINTYLLKKINSYEVSIRENFREKLKHVVFSSVSEGNIAIVNNEISDLVVKINKSKVFQETIEDNTLSFEHKTALVDRLIEELKNNLWLLQEQRDYLRWKNIHNHLSPNLKSIVEKLSAFPTSEWEKKYQEWIKQIIVENNDSVNFDTPLFNTQEAYTLYNEYTQLYTPYISEYWTHESSVKLKSLKKSNKKLFKALSSKKKEGFEWSSSLSGLVSSRFPIIMCPEECFIEFREYFNDDLFDYVITDNSDYGSYFMDHSVLNFKSGLNISTNALNESEYLVDYNYYEHASSLKLQSAAEKLDAGKGIDSMIASYRNNLRVFQFRGCSVVSFLNSTLHQEFLESLLAIGAKELRDSNSIPFSFQDILLEKNANILLLTEYHLLDHEDYDSLVWQQSLIDKFQKMGMNHIDFTSNQKEMKYGYVRKQILESLDSNVSKSLHSVNA